MRVLPDAPILDIIVSLALRDPLVDRHRVDRRVEGTLLNRPLVQRSATWWTCPQCSIRFHCLIIPQWPVQAVGLDPTNTLAHILQPKTRDLLGLLAARPRRSSHLRRAHTNPHRIHATHNPKVIIPPTPPILRVTSPQDS